MKKILVVLDMQNDFIDGPLGTPEARVIVDNVCAKIREGEWDNIIFTMDTHSEKDYSRTQEGKKLPALHCIKDSDGWKLNDDIYNALQSTIPIYESHKDELVGLKKDRFGSYALANTIEHLWDFVEDGTELTLVGVCTDICVISNALLLKAHFPEMKIVVDASCCAGSTPEKHYMALEVMKSCQVDVVNNEWDELKKNITNVVGKTFGVPLGLLEE